MLTEEELEQFTLQMYEKGLYSPPYFDEKQTMPGIEILDEDEDLKKRNDMMEEADRENISSNTAELSVFHIF